MLRVQSNKRAGGLMGETAIKATVRGRNFLSRTWIYFLILVLAAFLYLPPAREHWLRLEGPVILIVISLLTEIGLMACMLFSLVLLVRYSQPYWQEINGWSLKVYRVINKDSKGFWHIEIDLFTESFAPIWFFFREKHGKDSSFHLRNDQRDTLFGKIGAGGRRNLEPFLRRDTKLVSLLSNAQLLTLLHQPEYFQFTLHLSAWALGKIAITRKIGETICEDIRLIVVTDLICQTIEQVFREHEEFLVSDYVTGRKLLS